MLQCLARLLYSDMFQMSTRCIPIFGVSLEVLYVVQRFWKGHIILWLTSVRTVYEACIIVSCYRRIIKSAFMVRIAVPHFFNSLIFLFQHISVVVCWSWYDSIGCLLRFQWASYFCVEHQGITMLVCLFWRHPSICGCWEPHQILKEGFKPYPFILLVCFHSRSSFLNQSIEWTYGQNCWRFSKVRFLLYMRLVYLYLHEITLDLV